MRKEIKNNIGLYIHIPFCKYICTYCDFCKKLIKHYETSKYVDSLIMELNKYKDDFSNIDTIYIGGGTPTALPQNELQRIFDYLNSYINMEQIKEFTIEANPDDIVSYEYVSFLKKANINRISLGVQSINNNILSKINRGHTNENVKQAITLATRQIKNVSIDLMFNLPNQTTAHIEETLNFVSKYKDYIKHISYYSLIFEEDTVLFNSNFENLSPDEESEIYKLIQVRLETLGYTQYEISNYAQDGYESKHNLKYWNLDQYIGVGLGASSFLNKSRFTNTCSYEGYCQGVNTNNHIVDVEVITPKENLIESIILGLRTTKGIKQDILVENKIEISNEYFKEEGSYVAIKPEFFFISNQIILEILEKIN